MRDLLAKEATDAPAAEAVELFCYEVRKRIGSLAAALEGLDTLVFSGGIGENSPVVRARICGGLRFLGVEIDDAANGTGDERISRADSRVAVYCIPTNEELMIARLVYRHTRAGD
jgi:acetate kinase